MFCNGDTKLTDTIVEGYCCPPTANRRLKRGSGMCVTYRQVIGFKFKFPFCVLGLTYFNY